MIKDYYDHCSKSNLIQDIIDEQTEDIKKQEMQRNGKWYNPDGSLKKNGHWKKSDPSVKGKAGEEVVRTSIDEILSMIYGSNKVKVIIFNKGKGDFDVLITFLETGRTITIEVKTATEDSNDSHQFNGLKKVNYDYAFLFAVGTDDCFFDIYSYEELTKTLTTNMSRGITGNYKKCFSQKSLIPLNHLNLLIKLEEVGILTDT